MAHVFSPNPTAILGKTAIFCATLFNRDLLLKSKNNMICAVKESVYGYNKFNASSFFRIENIYLLASMLDVLEKLFE